MTTFLLIKNPDHHAIVNDDADFIVGRVYPLNGRLGPYRVTADIGPMDQTREAGTVQSLDEAIPAFLAFYEKYPVRWERFLTDEYWKNTLNAFLQVKRDQHGDWLAYRDHYPLLQAGEPARFGTCADAQRVADAHELDFYPNAKVIDDGYSWQPDPEIDWRSIPYRVEEREAWQRRWSTFLP
jgi:hypothetical protein